MIFLRLYEPPVPHLVLIRDKVFHVVNSADKIFDHAGGFPPRWFFSSQMRRSCAAGAMCTIFFFIIEPEIGIRWKTSVFVVFCFAISVKLFAFTNTFNALGKHVYPNVLSSAPFRRQFADTHIPENWYLIRWCGKVWTPAHHMCLWK